MARVRLLAAGDVAAEDRAVLDGLDAQGGLINLYRAMAQSPVALRRFLDLAGSLWGGALSERIREIAILSVVSASDAPYPLGWHLLDAVEAGLSEAEIRAVISGDAAVVLPAAEASVAQFARELTLDSQVGDATYQAVADSMGAQQIVELTLLAGLYRLVSCVANGLKVELDDAPARALERMRKEKA